MQVRKATSIRQKEIVQAARKLIVKHGSENVTIRKIAKEIGVTEGAIYKHFKSKRDVLSLLIDNIENTIIADIDSNRTGEVNTIYSLENIVTAHVSAIQQRKGVSHQVIAEILSVGDKKLNKQLTTMINKYIFRIKDILADGVKSGIIRPDIDLDATARMFFSLTQGLVTIWALSQYSFDLVKAYKPSWELFLKSIVRT